MNDEQMNAIVISASQRILTRMRIYRFASYLVAISFGYLFAYVLMNEPVLNTGVVTILAGSGVGVFSAVAVINASSAEIINQKMVVRLAKEGLMGQMMKILSEGEDE
jgi:hypothetical protein